MRTVSLELRFIFLAILGVIVPFGLALYVVPGQTQVYWPWVIPDPRSAIAIGAGYIGACLYYILALRESQWIRVKNGIVGLLLFSLVLLFATLMHWDAFRPYHIATLVWLMFYYTGFLMVPIVRRLELDLSTAEHGAPETQLPPLERRWLVLRGIVYLALALVILLFADQIKPLWPWNVELIDLRVMMAQVTAIGWSGIIAYRSTAWRSHQFALALSAAIAVMQIIGLFLGTTPYTGSTLFGLVLPLMFAEWLLTPLVLFASHRKS